MAARGVGWPETTLEVGCKVKAKSPDDEGWYPGRIREARGDSWVVAWDDPDGGPETHTLSEDVIKRMIFFKDYKVGDDCEAISPDDDVWYPGTVAEVLGGDKFRVRWDDPDGGDENVDVHWESMKKVNIKRDYQKGDEVFAKFPEDGVMYPSTVLKGNEDGTFLVKWEDPDGGPEETVVSPKDIKFPPIPYNKLKVGQKYTGTVTRCRDSHAYVDIGADRDGFLHIADTLAKRRVGEDMRALLEEDQEVEVWIAGLGVQGRRLRGDDGGKFKLTMIEGRRYGDDGRRFTDLTPLARQMLDDWFDGEVLSTTPSGAIVNVNLDSGQQAEGWVHVSQITDAYVEDINDFVEVGKRVKVKLMSVDDKGATLKFSMRADFRQDPGLLKRLLRPDLRPFLGVDPSTWLKGRVDRLTIGGAWVEVPVPGSDATAVGLVHPSRIRDGLVRDIDAELGVGQEVSVRVFGVDTESGYLDLSMISGSGGAS